MDNLMLDARHMHKHFTLHNQGGIRLDVLSDVSLKIERGQCVVLHGQSGTGKSTLLRSLYANYLPQADNVLVRHDDEWVDIVKAPSHQVLEIRRRTLGYVSQFLRVIPRVSTLDIVAEPLRRQGVPLADARDKAATYLERLNIPHRLWSLAPSTFSGGEQQRVNIAHCFVADFPILLLDEPTASLDAANRQVVVDLMHAAMSRGAALIGIFHDAEVRETVGTHSLDMATGQLRSMAA